MTWDIPQSWTPVCWNFCLWLGHLSSAGMSLTDPGLQNHPLIILINGLGAIPIDVETPTWWPELLKVPTHGDPTDFTKWVQASFQFSKAKCLGKGENDHTPPPTPHCIEWDAFLPQSRNKFTSEDYRLRQPRKTLAYAKTLQFWAKKARMPWAGEPD